MGRWATVACAALMCACASAGAPGDSDKSDDPAPDASRSFDVPDATPLPEDTPDAASVSIADAAPASAPDAANGSGLFCNSQSDCTIAGECCFFLVQPPGFCVVGEEVAGFCIPD